MKTNRKIILISIALIAFIFLLTLNLLNYKKHLNSFGDNVSTQKKQKNNQTNIDEQSSSSSSSASSSSDKTSVIASTDRWDNLFRSFNSKGILGKAASFNIFANQIETFNSLEGSFAAEKLTISQSWEKIGNDYTSYLQSQISAQDNKLTLSKSIKKIVFGNDFKLNSQSLDLINQSKTIGLLNYKDNFFYQDKNNSLINFANEFKRLNNNSAEIADYSMSLKNKLSVTKSESGDVSIDASKVPLIDKDVKYIYLQANQLPGAGKKIIFSKGFSSAKKIIISVDTSHLKQLSLNWINFADGKGNVISNKNILFSFYNSNKSVFSGAINVRFHNSGINAILAPSATVTSFYSSFQGTIVANKVISENDTKQESSFPDIEKR
ncbi:conserved protein of unknown function [Oenococcus oeni]|nr:hypothetical protein AX764_07540 [Oenococcus oeni]SYV98935.1 conserved hypothetical protein [Oenococcus oeni]SYV99308.1 conserved hypothetical protein [Oenococcus oeni]SYW18135.1 conserved hypothetical protein [Oenococcus oeni]VDC15272.1 conserved protein of unknown function [Oenococcus oeni]